MSSNEREFIIEKREEMRNIADKKARSALLFSLVGIGAGVILLVTKNTGPEIPSNIKNFLSAVPAATALATYLQHAHRESVNKNIDYYNSLLKGVTKDNNKDVQSKVVEQGGKTK